MPFKNEETEEKLADIFGILKRYHGPMKWWPVTPSGKVSPEYRGGPVSERQRFEVAVGAVLTQNTSWKNASAAIENMNREDILSPEAVSRIDEAILASIIRPSGYYNMKARKLKALAHFFLQGLEISRDSLLGIHGVGPETADSILLYAFDVPVFVVDGYTRRMFARIGLVKSGAPYEVIREFFEDNLPSDSALFQEYHALIVEHAKSFCRKSPQCEGCPLLNLCRHGRS